MSVLVGQKYRYKHHGLPGASFIVEVKKITYLPQINDEEIAVRVTEITDAYSIKVKDMYGVTIKVKDMYGVTHKTLLRDYVLVEDVEDEEVV
jgi:hypothetical protein